MMTKSSTIYGNLLITTATFLHILRLVHSFNIATTVESNENLKFEGDANSFLGFSLTTHKDNSNMTLLVGAPRANSPFEPNTTEPGAVYTCPLGSETPISRLDCRQLQVGHPGVSVFTDTSGNQLHYRDLEDEQWLGVAMATTVGATTDSTMVCGHRWRNDYYQHSQRWTFLNGICYLVRHNVSTVNFHHHITHAIRFQTWFYGLRQAGAAVHGTKDGVYYIGSPGYYNWRGGVMKFDSTMGDPCQIGGFGNEITVGSYLGYAVSSGSYFGGRRILVAAGGPRGGSGYVHIIAVSRCLGSIAGTLGGKQFNSYFGSALLTMDVNHDGADDLLVGAPFSTRVASDEGVVHVFYGNQTGNMTEGRILFGRGAPFGRFGTTIVDAKDIDSNGFNDVIIGAPYEDDNRGAIYIFSGGAGGLSRSYTQRIAAVDLPGMASGFGMAVTGGFDIDQNGITDIAVGSYLTNEVRVFRSRPVVNVEVGAVFLQPCIHLTESACRSVHENVLPCARLNVTISWNTRQPKSVSGNLDFLLVVNLTSEEISRRRGYLIDTQTLSRVPSQSVRVSSRRQQAVSHVFTVFIPRTHKDKFNAVEFTLRHELIARRSIEDIPPVLNLTETLSLSKHQIYVCKDCRDISLCKTDLVLRTDLSSDHVVIGDPAPLLITAIVTNTREPAYLTELNITFPQTLDFFHYQSMSKSVACQQIETQVLSLRAVQCLMGNPLPKDESAEVSLSLRVSDRHPVNQQVVITSSVTTVSFENQTELLNNIVTKSLPMKYSAEISEKSFSYPAKIIVDQSTVSESSRGHMIKHVIDIKNAGPGTTPFFPISIEFPSMENLGIFLEYGDLDFAHENKIGGSRNQSNCTADVHEQLQDKVNKSNTLGTSSKTDDGPGTYLIKAFVSKFKSKEKIHFNPKTHRHQDILCIIDPIRPGKRVTISYWLTVRVSNLDVFDNIEYVEFHTHIRIPATPDQFTTTVTDKIVNTILPPVAVSSGVPWYISVASGVAGLMVLVILIVVFSKCGFFKRGHRDEMTKLLQEDEDGDLLKRQPVDDNQYEPVLGAVGGATGGAIDPYSADDYDDMCKENPYETLPDLPPENDYLLPDGNLYEEPNPTSPTELLGAEQRPYQELYTPMGGKWG